MEKKEATALGLRTYNTGRRCKHGHRSERTTQGGKCIECVRRYNRHLRLINPEKLRAQSRKWYQNNKERKLAQDRERRERMREQDLEGYREHNRLIAQRWRDRHRKHYRAYQRKYQRAWRRRRMAEA